MPVEPLGLEVDSRQARPVRAGRGRISILLGSSTVLGLSINRLWAQDEPSVFTGLGIGSFTVGTTEVIQLAMFAGAMGAALLSAIWMIRERARIAAENVELRARVADLTAAQARAEALVGLKDMRVLFWQKGAERPDLSGGLSAGAGAPQDRAAFLAFGRWLTPHSASAIDAGIAALRDHSRPFDLVVETQTGAHLEVQGRSSIHHMIVRFLTISEARRAYARLRIENQRLEAEFLALRGLFEASRLPAWTRDRTGRIVWVNAAYAAAVDASTPEIAVAEERELLGTPVRKRIAEIHASRSIFNETVSTVIGGDRRHLMVTSVATSDGSAGFAIDRSEQEALLAEIDRAAKGHAETLDRLQTAIAIFDGSEKLRFYNAAFQKLWDIDAGFLDSAPEHNLLLDRLRSEGKLAEQPEWRRWKESVLQAYRSVEPHDANWHLPDGRTLRVVTSPHPNGGVTWIFDNLTERIDLESRYKTAVRVQSETLDHLAEGVVVFGADGRLKLTNPAFGRLWRLPDALAVPGVHISAIRDACRPMAAQSPWDAFASAVTGFDEERRDSEGVAELVDGSVLRHTLVHLPNGQAMITFIDVTDSVNVERALKDKNEALQNADRLKNDFVQHVSYELRSPLTNIIGFTELLGMPDTGPLNERQREYVGHIGSSSAILLAIVNDILDLATVDAGIMELEIGDVRITDAVESAAERVAERMRDHDIELSLDLPAAAASFRADGNRVRQILANLLTNAANFAPAGSTVTLSCRKEGSEVRFTVHDDGPGMPPDVLDAVYRRFESRANGGRRRGAGLGLSIVKSFVELHGGTVEIETGEGIGTTVTCVFPASPRDYLAAAE
ncbi:MAG: PAS-domain containing protein [Rhizobiaceae bacterium]|nr:PAS-domain containing protein [Rhizobiaceae bacterium]MCV0404704.1 PAS-domain containing protein [Rhizobiaceae bacterium]